MSEKNYWLVKQEPDAYAFATFQKEKMAQWTGVRNFQARNFLRGMKKGDVVFYYHSNVGKEVVGLASVERAAYPDPTAKEGDWSCVDLKAGRALPRTVTLEQMKTDKRLKEIGLIRQSRLSVMPVTEAEAAAILELAGAA